MSRYPWTVLGLEAPAGERDIRSAYARRLKVVRPDEDPAGFQVLVEARSLALELARTQAAEDLVAEDLAAEEVAAEEVAPEDVSPEHDWNDGDRRSIASEGTSVDVVKPVSKIPEAAFSAVSEGVGIDLRSPTQAVATDPPASPSIAAPVSIELQAPAPSPVFPPATGELPSALVATNGPQVAPAETILLAPDEIVARLRKLLGSMGPPPASGDAASLLVDLERLPRSIRQMIEPDILQAMARSLPAPAKDTFLRRSALLRRMHVISGESAQQRQSTEIRRGLFVALDENFCWTTSDRRVHQTLPHGQATQLMAYLHASQRILRIAREGVPPRWDGDGLPVLESADLQAFFGSELPHYGGAYQQARRARRWTPDWRPWTILFAPIWMIVLRHYRLIGAWLAALFITGILLADIETYLAPALSKQFPANSAGLIALANTLAIGPVAALHLYVARNNVRLEVERLARIAAKADRQGLFDPQARAAFLKRRAPSFRFEDGKKKSGWTWGGNWWWIIVGITVFRLIGMMLK